MFKLSLFLILNVFLIYSTITVVNAGDSNIGQRPPEVELDCPKVKSIRNFHLEQMLGKWYVVQYYASSEEALAYRCMRAEFTMDHDLETVTMNFTYSFTDDPINEQLMGNISWEIPDKGDMSHWTHSEDIYEGVYNTFVLDSDYTSWLLLLHCAEKSKSPRYLSSLILSRNSMLGINVVSYLRDKLPKYKIDLQYMFEMGQSRCDEALNGIEIPPSVLLNMQKNLEKKKNGNNGKRRHPMHHNHKKGSKKNKQFN